MLTTNDHLDDVSTVSHSLPLQFQSGFLCVHRASSIDRRMASYSPVEGVRVRIQRGHTCRIQRRLRFTVGEVLALRDTSRRRAVVFSHTL
jgi:hypothetical protein